MGGVEGQAGGEVLREGREWVRCWEVGYKCRGGGKEEGKQREVGELWVREDVAKRILLHFGFFSATCIFPYNLL